MSSVEILSPLSLPSFSTSPFHSTLARFGADIPFASEGTGVGAGTDALGVHVEQKTVSGLITPVSISSASAPYDSISEHGSSSSGGGGAYESYDAYDDDGDEDEHIFPDLPPLHRGHPSLHTRSRVSSILADAQDVDESAFFTADLSLVLSHLHLWRAHLPTITPFYAVKCNPDPYVLRLLAGSGAGFDCASAGEIRQVLSMFSSGEERKRVGRDRVVFANPCKAASFIRGARKEGVEMMTFDNHDELLKIAKLYPPFFRGGRTLPKAHPPHPHRRLQLPLPPLLQIRCAPLLRARSPLARARA